MKRGSVYWVNLGIVSPPKSGKIRPAVIVSNSVQNEILDSVVVIPLSSRPGEIWPLRLEITIDEKQSFAVLPGIRQVSKKRLADLAGRLSPEDTQRIDEALHVYLGE